MADNDYAIGLLIEKVAHSPYANDILIFIIEDDAQDGPDHVDAHRSIAYVVGPYVRQGTVVSRPYNTVNMVRTIEEVLGLDPLGLTDGLAEPMTDVFEMASRPWTYDAIYPEPLMATDLPQPATLPLTARGFRNASPRCRLLGAGDRRPKLRPRGRPRRCLVQPSAVARHQGR
jgi:hypothetical protein